MSPSAEFLERHFPAAAARAHDSLHVPPPPPATPRDWRRAWRLVRELAADPSRTEKVFELFEAVSGGDDERHFREFLAKPEGRALAHERPSLVSAMADRVALAALPEGSLGRAYHAFALRNGFAADGLIQAQMGAARAQAAKLDPLRQWFYDRLNVSHDLWHVLTGYETDEAGEAGLLAFTVAQFPTAGLRTLTIVAGALGLLGGAVGFPRYLFEAWRRGRRAGDLVVARFEELLPLPLDEARQRLAIEPLEMAHPRGRYVGSRAEGAFVRMGEDRAAGKEADCSRPRRSEPQASEALEPERERSASAKAQLG